MSSQDTVNNKFDPVTGDIVPVFFRYAIPSVIGMIAVTSAGVIDGIFIGNFIGASALAAINICIPVFAFYAAIVLMLAVGGSVVCGKNLGEGNTEAASDIFSKTVYATLAMGLAITLICLLFLDDVIVLLGANDELHEMARDYLLIIVAAAPFLVIGLTLDYFVRIDGRPVLASVTLVGFAVINIALDWLFIIHLEWGIKGAAWATAIAEASIFLALISHWFHPACNLKFLSVRGGWGRVLHAAWNGLSEFANEASIGLVTLMFNWVMITRLGVVGVAAFTIVGYLLFIGLEICYGISESLQPTVSKNLGARKASRIVKFTLTAVIASFVIGLGVSIVFIFAPETMISLFLREGEDQTVEIALEFIALFWPAFLFNGMNITLASYFTALHKPLQSVAIALSRSLVLPGLGLLLLPIWFGATGIYIAIPLAEALTFILALVLVNRYPPSQIIRSTDLN
jgi:Na+-driven multidrug efflux pump